MPSVARRALAVVALVAAQLSLVSAAHAADRAFSVRYSANDTGNVTFAANTLMTCPSSDNDCVAARNAGPTSTSNSDYNNDSYEMEYVDVDSDSSTFNSSRASLTLPATAQVLFAGLYWSGDRSPGTGGTAAPAGSSATTVKLLAPGASSYASLTSDRTDESNYDDDIYSSFKDVTSQVQAAGAGQYTVANVQAGKGDKGYAGWALFVAYRDTSQPARNLTIIDGFKSIGPSNPPTDIPVSGFQTPPGGTVHTELGMLAWEGDLGIVGDSAALNGTVLSDAQHLAGNYFDSKISQDGTLFTAKSPNYNTQFGMDVAFQNADGILPNNATSATIRVTTSGDLYLPSAFSFVTELYAPKIDQVKSVTDLNGGDVEQGDVLEYKITGKNNGQDGAVDFVLRDPIPAGTAYVPGSLNIADSGGGPTGTMTDAIDGDQGERDGSNRIVARLGTGATSSAGGKIGVGKTYDVRFKVTVGSNPASGTVIHNVATSSFKSESLNTPLTAVSTKDVTVKHVDLTIAKTRNGPIVPGSDVSYGIVVSNVGAAPSTGSVTVSDTLPSTLTPTSASGSGWSCGIAAQTVTCTRSGALAAGAAFPAIDLVVHAAPDAEGAIDNTATVSGGGDGNLANNTSTAPGSAAPQIDLAMTKDTNHATVGIGDFVTYTLVATNNGPSKATGVTVNDPLPAGLQLWSAETTIGSCSGAVVCSIGTLMPGDSATVTIIVRTTAAAAGTTVHNVATVAGAQTETNTANNTDFADVYVAAADLAVVKTVSPASPVAGGPISWDIHVTNNGPSAANGVQLRDVLPTELDGTPTITVVSGDADCAIAAGELVCDLGTMADGDEVVVRIAGTLKDDLGTASIDNTATVTGAEPELDTTNNTSTVTSTVASAADLALDKVASVNGIDAGEQVSYTLTATNHGSSAATGVKIVDPVPAGMTFVSADGGCTQASGTITCTIGNLAVGASVVRHITLQAGEDTEGVVINTGTVSGTTPDPNHANDSDSAPVVVSIPVADLSLEKTADPVAIGPGGEVTYTLVATNHGPADAEGVEITDPVPAGMSFVSAGSGCTIAGGTITCTIGALASGDHVTRTIVLKAQPGTTGTVVNTGTVSSTTTDADHSNDSDDATIDVAAPNADLSIDKTAAPASIEQGAQVTYTLKVTNHGPQDAIGVKITDPVPAGMTFVSAASGCTLTAGTVTCTIGALASGANVTKTIVLAAGAGITGTVVNTGTVSADTADANPSNNSDDASITVVAPSADLALLKTATPENAVPGDTVTYTLVVTNHGPSAAANAKITDTLPAGMTFVSADGGCTFAGGTVTCLLGTLAKNASATRHIVVTVAAGTTGSVKNTGTASSTTSDPNPANNSDDATVTVTGKADVSIVKSAAQHSAAPGDVVDYTLKVRNDGPGTARDVVASDPIPGGLEFVSVQESGCAFAAGVLTCQLGDIPAGEERVVHFKARVTASVAETTDHQHLLPVSKVEQQVDLEAGQQRSIALSCPSGTLMTDGAIRVDHVDQDTGTLASVRVLRARSRAGEPRTYEFVVKNTASGRAQTKAFGTCMADRTTEVSGHGHALIVDEVSTTSAATLTAGRHDVAVECEPHQVAMAPGYDSTGGTVRLVRSWPEGAGRGFTFEVTGTATVTASVRCVNLQLDEAAGHTHRLDLEFIERTVTVGAGQTIDASVICGDLAKGIVAAWDLPPGLLGLGNDPQPKSRVFRIQNTTSGPLTAKLGLLCVGDRTTSGSGIDSIVNTASVTSTTEDVDSDDLWSSATIELTAATEEFAPPSSGGSSSSSSTSSTSSAPAPDNVQPEQPAPFVNPGNKQPVAVAGSRLAAQVDKVRVQANGTVVVAVLCGAGTQYTCNGKLTLRAAEKVRAGGKTYKAGAKLATVAYKVVGGKKSGVKVTLAPALARLAAKGKLPFVKVQRDGETKNQVTMKVRRVTR